MIATLLMKFTIIKHNVVQSVQRVMSQENSTNEYDKIHTCFKIHEPSSVAKEKILQKRTNVAHVLIEEDRVKVLPLF